MDLPRAALTALGGGADGLLRIHRPRPTAFSRRDSLAPGFPAAAAAAAEHGFALVIRPADGRLAAYHGDALVLDLVGPHPAPHGGQRARFAAAASALTDGLRVLGDPARSASRAGLLTVEHREMTRARSRAAACRPPGRTPPAAGRR